jgi:hypothetical protein
LSSDERRADFVPEHHEAPVLSPHTTQSMTISSSSQALDDVAQGIVEEDVEAPPPDYYHTHA